MSAHVLYAHSCRLKNLQGFPSCFIVVKKRTDVCNTMLTEICNGSMNIAYGVQHKAGSDFFSFHREIGKEVHKALEDAVRGVVRFSCNHGNILWSDCSLKRLVVPKFIPSSTVGKSYGGVSSSSHLVAYGTQIGFGKQKVNLAFLPQIVLQMWGHLLADAKNVPYARGQCSDFFLWRNCTMKGKLYVVK